MIVGANAVSRSFAMGSEMVEDSEKLSIFQVMQSRLGNAFQKTQSSIMGKLNQVINHQPSSLPGNDQFREEHISDLDRQLQAWRKNNVWTDAPAQTKVTVPKGSLCHLDATFQLGIPPDAVFNIAIDPENSRVFKNIKEVRYRKVLEDEGHRQLVQVEQVAIWKFLWLSGTMNVNVFVDQDRRTHSIKFYLAKEGFMKRFEGSWKIKPLFLDQGVYEDGTNCTSQRIASEVHLQQLLQPALMPPPPLSWYLRGITARTIEGMIGDLQSEAARLRELGQGKVQELQSQSLPNNSQQNEPFVGKKTEQRQWLVRACRRPQRKSTRHQRDLSVRA